MNRSLKSSESWVLDDLFDTVCSASITSVAKFAQSMMMITLYYFSCKQRGENECFPPNGCVLHLSVLTPNFEKYVDKARYFIYYKKRVIFFLYFQACIPEIYGIHCPVACSKNCGDTGLCNHITGECEKGLRGQICEESKDLYNRISRSIS